jgi:Cu/Ag efflux pump CusA
MTQLPIDVLPDLNRPRVTVFTEAEWLWAQEVEQVVTMPLERIFATIPWVQAVRSSSALWLSVINVEFDRWSKTNLNRQQVFERIQSATLPDGVHTSVAPETALLGEILRIWLSSEDPSIDQSTLRWIAESAIRQTLTNVPWISNLLIMWWSPKQFTVEIDPSKAVARGVSNEDIVATLENSTFPAWWWVVLQETTEFPVSITPIPGTNKNIGSLQIVQNEVGQKTIINDIATVNQWSNAQRRWDALINGKPWVIVRISKIPLANTMALTEEIESQLWTIEKNLPKWVTLHKELFRQWNFIEKWLSNVQKALIEAMLIVAIVIAMFLMNSRTTMIVLLSLPITFLLTAIVFKIFWVWINIMILWWLTIAIGELVDDSIVDMENVYRRLKENYLRPISKQKNWRKVIFDASREVRWSVVFATILQMIVFVPFLLLPGLDGRLLAPIGIAYLISSIMSLLVALTFVPAICSYILPGWIQRKYEKKYPELYKQDNSDENIDVESKRIHEIIEKEEDTWLTKKLKKFAIHPIHWSLENPKKALWWAILCLPLTVFMYLQVGKEWLPPFNETSFTIGITTKPWSSLEYTLWITEKFAQELSNIEWILSTATILGRADADAHAQWSNNAEIEAELWIDISNNDKDKIFDKINTVIKEYKQYAVISVGQPITHRVEELVSWIRAPLVIKIYWPDVDKLEEYGKEILAVIEWVDGVINASLEPQTKVPSIVTIPNLVNQSLYWINNNEVKEIIEIAVWWKEVSQIIDGQLRYPVILTYDSSLKDSVQKLSWLPVLSPNKQQITLWSLTTVKESKARNMINHENGQRRIVIQWFTENRWIVDVVEDIKLKLNTMQLENGYRISYEGLYQAQQESSLLLAFVTIFVLLWICWVLYFHFHSWRIVAQLLLDILTWWLWWMIWVWLSGGILSTAHLVWFIALMGIVWRNGIMLIDHYKHLHLVEWLPWNKQTIIQWSLERVVPVSMTALSAILWLLPLVIASKDTWNEILWPIAIVTFWWLIVSTAIELFIRPWVFYHFNKAPSHKQTENEELTF